MTALINASTSSGVVVTSDTSGSLAFQSNGTTIATISSTGLTMNSGSITQSATAAPAFSAYGNSTQNVSSATWTKVTFAVEEFDTNSNFASSTFTPTVAGYYQINGNINFGGSSQSTATVRIYKNGSAYKYGQYISSSVGNLLSVSCLVYLNGSTDYVELYGLVVATSPQFIADSQATWFNGAMVRSA